MGQIKYSNSIEEGNGSSHGHWRSITIAMHPATYRHIDIPNGHYIEISNYNVVDVIVIPHTGCPFAIEMLRNNAERIPTKAEIETLITEIENDEEFPRAFIVFSFATLLALYYCIEGHHGIWPAPLETISGEVNWAQFILDGLKSIKPRKILIF